MGRSTPPRADAISVVGAQSPQESFGRLHMENFAATTIIILVGMAIPILFLVAAIVFDLALGAYMLFKYVRNRLHPHIGTPEHAGVGHMAHTAHRSVHPMVPYRA
jgi:hypothetical protein